LQPKLFNCFARFFARRVLNKIPYPEGEQENIRQLAQQGHLVYVQRAKSGIFHLALASALARQKLPRAQFVTGARLSFLRPYFGLFAKSGPRRNINRLVKYFRKKPVMELLIHGGDAPQAIQALIALQRVLDKPIFLLPHFLALRSRPAQFEPTTVDLLFGGPREPKTLRSIIRMIFAQNSARWVVLEPINLQNLVATHAAEDDLTIARKVRWTVLKAISRIEKAHHGPPLKSHARVKTDTLRDKQLQSFLSELSEETGVPKVKLEQKAESFFTEIAARFDGDVIRVLDKILSTVWNRIYDGLYWDKKDIEKIRQASREGPIVLVPSHKSHMDYLVMSQLFFWEGLIPPHIAAGVNLAFFPIGGLLRRGGAYFIRRTFKGDRIYPQVVKAYLKRLFKEGFTQEFFIEGGRSRSGKTLSPKLGLLSIMVDGLLSMRQGNAVFVPASISYEKLVEAQSHRRELEGGEKEKENANALIRSVGILRKRYGRVFVTFDEPIVFRKFLEERGLNPDNVTSSERKALVKVLSQKIVYGMNQCTQVTSTALVATALFGANRRTLPFPLLILYVKRILAHMRHFAGADLRLAEDLSQNLNEQVDHALQLFLADGLLTQEKASSSVYYRINEQNALGLDYYKSNILHHFAQDAILATAFFALGGSHLRPISEKSLFQATKAFSQIFKFEFTYPVGVSFSSIFERHLHEAQRQHIFEIKAGVIALCPTTFAETKLNFAARLIANFVDGYWLCARKVPILCGAERGQKALPLELLDAAKKAYLNGSVECPEAANKAIMENALRLFVDQGILLKGDGRPVLNPQGKERLAEILRWLEKAHRRH